MTRLLSELFTALREDAAERGTHYAQGLVRTVEIGPELLELWFGHVLICEADRGSIDLAAADLVEVLANARLEPRAEEGDDVGE